MLIINESHRNSFLKFLLFINVIMVSAIFRVREYGSDTIDFQILIKLAVWAVTLGFCLLYLKLWMKHILNFENIFLFLFLCLITFSCFYAPSLRYSIGCAFSLVTVFSLIFLSSRVLGNRVTLQIIFAALTLISMTSILFYFAFPEIGRLSEWQNGQRVLGTRLSLVAGGTPNGMGFVAAFAIFIGFYLKKYESPEKSSHLYLLSAINLAALLMSGSKSSMASLILALIVGFYITFTSARLALLFISLSIILITGAMVDLDHLFSFLSRSGEIEEITSGTGRAFIWPIALDLIAQKPLLGWGYASSSRILPEFSDVIGHPPTHTHNLFLQILFSLGYCGLIVFMLLYFVKLCSALKFKDEYKFAGLIFMLFRGLAESPGFVGVATTPTLAFATILALEFRNRNELHQN